MAFLLDPNWNQEILTVSEYTVYDHDPTSVRMLILENKNLYIKYYITTSVAWD
jgi:hypothetical protein